jgi:anti-repressor protein
MSINPASQLIPFEFEGESVRTVIGEDGEPLFVAKDVAETLGYADTDQAVRQHCKAAVSYPVEMTGQVRRVKMIPERDVYRLVMRSKLPAAARFEEWVVGEVLPSIRKTGRYEMTDALNDPTFLRATLLTYTEKVIALEAKVKEDAPKVDFHDKYAKAEGNKGIREVAKLLHANEREFVAFLRTNNIMYRLGEGGRLMPYAHHQHAGRFDVKTGVGNNDHAFQQAMFTPKGVAWIAAEWDKYQSAIAA